MHVAKSAITRITYDLLAIASPLRRLNHRSTRRRGSHRLESKQENAPTSGPAVSELSVRRTPKPLLTSSPHVTAPDSKMKSGISQDQTLFGLDPSLFAADHNTCLYPCQEFFARGERKKSTHPRRPLAARPGLTASLDARIMPTFPIPCNICNLNDFMPTVLRTPVFVPPRLSGLPATAKPARTLQSTPLMIRIQTLLAQIMIPKPRLAESVKPGTSAQPPPLSSPICAFPPRACHRASFLAPAPVPPSPCHL